MQLGCKHLVGHSKRLISTGLWHIFPSVLANPRGSEYWDSSKHLLPTCRLQTQKYAGDPTQRHPALKHNEGQRLEGTLREMSEQAKQNITRLGACKMEQAARASQLGDVAAQWQTA